VGSFFGRRETLNEQLVREAGLGPPRERRGPVRGVLRYPGLFVPVFRPIWVWWAKREQRKLVKYAGERGYLSEQEAAQGREEFRLRAPDTPPPGFG
jgi:hypothetical protein